MAERVGYCDGSSVVVGTGDGSRVIVGTGDGSEFVAGDIVGASVGAPMDWYLKARVKEMAG